MNRGFRAHSCCCGLQLGSESVGTPGRATANETAEQGGPLLHCPARLFELTLSPSFW